MVIVEISGEEHLPEKFRLSGRGTELLGALFGRVVSELIPSLKGHGMLEVSVNILSEEDMAELNQHYRSEEGATDVLSFPLWEGVEGFAPPPRPWPELPLGDILVCGEQVEKNALEHEVAFLEEYLLVIVHGFLHLIGFDHDTEEKERYMWNLQERYRDELKRSLQENCHCGVTSHPGAGGG